MVTDHSEALETLAARHNLSPLCMLELFLCAASLREHEGMSREYAEREAVRDVEALLCGASAAVQMQRVGACSQDVGAP